MGILQTINNKDIHVNLKSLWDGKNLFVDGFGWNLRGGGGGATVGKPSDQPLRCPTPRVADAVLARRWNVLSNFQGR